MKIGGEEHKKNVESKFNVTFQKMTGLLKQARAVEFQLKIYFDVQEHVKHLKGKDYLKYAGSNFVSAKPKMDKLINKVGNESNLKKLQTIRLFAEPLAHADYWKARKQINAYAKLFSVENDLSSNPYPERFIEKVGDEDGNISNYARFVRPDVSNTIIEEFYVFDHQGYTIFAEQVFSEIETEFDLASISWLFEILMLSKAIRPENKLSNK